MDKNRISAKASKNISNKKMQKNPESISYRLKCAKTANGLSHFVMYGDVQKEKTVL